MNDKSYEFEKLKTTDRFATTIAGIIFFIFSIFLILTELIIIHELINKFETENIKWLVLNFVLLCVFSYFVYYSCIYTYRGYKGYRLVKKQKTDEQDPNKSNSKHFDWFNFIFFLCLSLLAIYALVTEEFVINNWKSWMLVFGFFMFSGMTVISLVTLSKNLSANESEQLVKKFLGYLYGLPIIIGILLVILWFVFDWFTSIPSWATVIIILLILILLNMKK